MNVSLTTAFRWRHLFSRWLEQDVQGHLEGIVEMDETFFKQSEKGRKPSNESLANGVDRHPDADLQRTGLCFHGKGSFEALYGVGDRNGAGFRGMVNRGSCPIIAEDSPVVSDGSASGRKPGSQEKLNHIIVENYPGKRAVGAYHIQNLNAYHSRLKLWINEYFHGVATKYLPRYPGGQHEIENKHIQNAMDLFQVAIHRIAQLRVT